MIIQSTVKLVLMIKDRLNAKVGLHGLVFPGNINDDLTSLPFFSWTNFKVRIEIINWGIWRVVSSLLPTHHFMYTNRNPTYCNSYSIIQHSFFIFSTGKWAPICSGMTWLLAPRGCLFLPSSEPHTIKLIISNCLLRLIRIHVLLTPLDHATNPSPLTSCYM